MSNFKNFRGKNGLNLSMEFSGFAEAMAGLNSLPITMGQSFKGVLRDWAEDVLARSQQLVPVGATGNLKASGQVSGPEMKDGALEVHIGYGDRKTAWYAQIVHERLDVRHPQGQAKFLETPINENLKALDHALAGALERALEKVA